MSRRIVLDQSDIDMVLFDYDGRVRLVTENKVTITYNSTDPDVYVYHDMGDLGRWYNTNLIMRDVMNLKKQRLKVKIDWEDSQTYKISQASLRITLNSRGMAKLFSLPDNCRPVL